METGLNIELRKEVLEIALNIEKMVSDLLILYLNIEKEDRKAICNKSTSLSFKNKIDLLFDLEVFSKDEYNKLLLLMEFRNQFLHNYECDTFPNAGKFLGQDKLKKLLSYDNVDFEGSSENFKYINAYRALHLSCIDDVIRKIKRKEQISKEKRELVLKLGEYTQFVIEADTKLLSEIIEVCMPNKDDSESVIGLKMQIHSIIINETTELSKSQSFNDYQKEILAVITKTIKYFK